MAISFDASIDIPTFHGQNRLQITAHLLPGAGRALLKPTSRTTPQVLAWKMLGHGYRWILLDVETSPDAFVRCSFLLLFVQFMQALSAEAAANSNPYEILRPQHQMVTAKVDQFLQSSPLCAAQYQGTPREPSWDMGEKSWENGRGQWKTRLAFKAY